MNKKDLFKPTPKHLAGESKSPSDALGGDLERGKPDGWKHTHTKPSHYGKTKQLAREMRKNPTPAEEVLWRRIRKRQILGYKFRRQHTIGKFIVDFFCADAALVIEVDGLIHDEQEEYDRDREIYLESLGLRVLRFRNEHVLQQIDGVLERIGEALSEDV